MNGMKTVALLAFMTALVWWLGDALLGPNGFWWGLLFAVGLNFIAYFFSDSSPSSRVAPSPYQ